MIQAGTAMIRAGTAIDVRAEDVILMASTRICSMGSKRAKKSSVGQSWRAFEKKTYKVVLCPTWERACEKKLAKHEVGTQVKKNQKACTTSTMGTMGRQARKKKKKTQGPTGVLGRTSAVAKLVAQQQQQRRHHHTTLQHRHTTRNTTCPTKCRRQSFFFSVLAVLQVTTAERQKTTIVTACKVECSGAKFCSDSTLRAVSSCTK
jgi:hypothetical protein